MAWIICECGTVITMNEGHTCPNCSRKYKLKEVTND